jgi:hypothetical protein
LVRFCSREYYTFIHLRVGVLVVLLLLTHQCIRDIRVHRLICNHVIFWPQSKKAQRQTKCQELHLYGFP